MGVGLFCDECRMRSEIDMVTANKKRISVIVMDIGHSEWISEYFLMNIGGESKST